MLHATTKKTEKTAPRDLDVAARRFQQLASERSKVTEQIKITKGSGNVFLDLGFPEGEAQNLLLRADLMIRIEKLVKGGGLTQGEAAKTLGITQPRLNALLKGKIGDFSLDALVNMLACAGMQVKMTVKKLA